MNPPKSGTSVEQLHFFELFLAKRNLEPVYTKIYNSFSKKIIYDKHISPNNYFSKKTVVIKDIPDYLEAEILNEKDILKIKKVSTYDGYAINIQPYSNINEYLSENFGKASRSKLRRYQNRLDNCFNITYKMYYGEITKDQFTFLFTELRGMLEKRFTQKKEENYELQNWEKYQNLIFPLINDKKASVFVIYDGSKPIDICVNLIYDKIVYSSLSSYDINYAAFSMGSIDMIKLIEWCIDNKFETIDLLKGYYYYKQKWINKIYGYQNHIIYDSSSLPTVIYANFKAISSKYFYILFQLLKRWKFDEFYHYFKRKIYKPNLPEIDLDQPTSLRPIQEIKIPPEHELNEIDLDNSKYNYIKKTLYDFLYTSHESINAVKILQQKNSKTSFIFKGKLKNIEVVFADRASK